LMKARGISEGEAYGLLRKSAMDRGKKITEIAAALDDEEIREIADYYAAIDLEITQVD
ncbi:MAG: ANTAR domain-containing protein, partial [Pseudomonadota bacterium]